MLVTCQLKWIPCEFKHTEPKAAEAKPLIYWSLTHCLASKARRRHATPPTPSNSNCLLFSMLSGSGCSFAAPADGGNSRLVDPATTNSFIFTIPFVYIFRVVSTSKTRLSSFSSFIQVYSLLSRATIKTVTATRLAPQSRVLMLHNL